MWEYRTVQVESATVIGPHSDDQILRCSGEEGPSYNLRHVPTDCHKFFNCQVSQTLPAGEVKVSTATFVLSVHLKKKKITYFLTKISNFTLLLCVVCILPFEICLCWLRFLKDEFTFFQVQLNTTLTYISCPYWPCAMQKYILKLNQFVRQIKWVSTTVTVFLGQKSHFVLLLYQETLSMETQRGIIILKRPKLHINFSELQNVFLHRIRTVDFVPHHIH